MKNKDLELEIISNGSPQLKAIPKKDYESFIIFLESEIRDYLRNKSQEVDKPP